MIIFAINIHTGGGKILLDELLMSKPFGPITHLYLDCRYSLPENLKNTFKISSYKPTLFERLKAHYDIYRNNNSDNTVLFFGNLPPFFKLNAKTIVYLQNCFLISSFPLPKDNFKVYLKMLVERIILKLFRSNIDEIWVQSQWMNDITKSEFPEKEIRQKPFLPRLPNIINVEKKFDFITVTSLAKHKNLKVFLDALELLDAQLISVINVLIVLDGAFNQDNLAVPHLKKVKLHIKSNLSRIDLFTYYQLSKTAVVTSSIESFCLPLREALHFKLNIICFKAGYSEEFSDAISLYLENKAEDLCIKLKKLT